VVTGGNCDGKLQPTVGTQCFLHRTRLGQAQRNQPALIPTLEKQKEKKNIF